MATQGAIGKDIATALNRIEETTDKIRRQTGVPALELPPRSRYGSESLRRDQVVAVADYLSTLQRALTKSRTTEADLRERIDQLEAVLTDEQREALDAETEPDEEPEAEAAPEAAEDATDADAQAEPDEEPDKKPKKKKKKKS